LEGLGCAWWWWWWWRGRGGCVRCAFGERSGGGGVLRLATTTHTHTHTQQSVSHHDTSSASITVPKPANEPTCSLDVSVPLSFKQLSFENRTFSVLAWLQCNDRVHG
jgi:hypothetical protein